MFAACNEMCVCVWFMHVCVFFLEILTNNTGGTLSPRDQRESHLPRQRQPVINPSAVCQREQQKASSSFCAVNSPHGSLLSQHQLTLTSCH